MYTFAIAATNLFIRKVSEISEPDYGDFMRKANLYLNILVNTIFRFSTPQVKKLLYELQYLVQYQASWNIETTLPKIYTRANLIKDLLSDPTNHAELNHFKNNLKNLKNSNGLIHI